MNTFENWRNEDVSIDIAAIENRAKELKSLNDSHGKALENIKASKDRQVVTQAQAKSGGTFTCGN